MGRPQGWLNRDDGVETLLRCLRRGVFKAVIPDLRYHMDEFFFRLRRRRHESLTEYAMRSRDKYIKMQKALARVVKKAKKQAEPKPQDRDQEEDEENTEEADNNHLDAASTQWKGSSGGSWNSWWHGGGTVSRPSQSNLA